MKVKIDGTQEQTTTDSAGKFKLVIPANLLNTKLQISTDRPGFLSSNIILRPEDVSNNQLFLLREMEVMGELMYEPPKKGNGKK